MGRRTGSRSRVGGRLAPPGAWLAFAAWAALGATAAQEDRRGGAPETIRPPERIAGDEETAAELVRLRAAAERSGKPIDWYNYGTALLGVGRWEEATESLRRAVVAEDATVRGSAFYNQGLARAEAGRRRAVVAEARRERLLEARDAFRAVLRREPAAEDARWNLELVERWLDEEERPTGGSGASGAGGLPDAGGGGGAGADGRAAEPVTVGREEAEALLGAAGAAERSARERLLERARLRDPVVERNW